jgi:hypothetical protein
VVSSRATRFAFAIIVWAGMVASIPSTASAQEDVPRRPIQVRFEDERALVNAAAEHLVDRALRSRIESGLPQTIVTRVYAYRNGQSDPIALGLRSCRVTYDPWRLDYRVRIQTADVDQSTVVRTLDQVIASCISIHDLPIGRRDDWRSARGSLIWFAVLIEHNPLSPETVQRIRRWLARPDGPSAESDAFFGSFVSLFVNRQIGEAERIFRFRSTEEVPCP